MISTLRHKRRQTAAESALGKRISQGISVLVEGKEIRVGDSVQWRYFYPAAFSRGKVVRIALKRFLDIKDDKNGRVWTFDAASVAMTASTSSVYKETTDRKVLVKLKE